MTGYRTVLVHLNVELAPSDSRGVDDIRGDVEAALDAWPQNDGTFGVDFAYTVALAEEV